MAMKDFQLEAFKDSPRITSRLQKVNPMVLKYGAGPADRNCAFCVSFFVGGTGARGHFKCRWRGNTSGAGTDHRANWEACSKYEQVKNFTLLEGG